MTAAKSLHSPVSPANPPKGFKSLSCIMNITQDVYVLNFTLFDTSFTYVYFRLSPSSVFWLIEVLLKHNVETKLTWNATQAYQKGYD